MANLPVPAVQTRLRAIWRLEILAIIVIALAALAIRIWGVRGGLPYVDHPDEPNPVGYVVKMLRTGDLDPHAFQKPSLYVYMVLAVVSVHYWIGLAAGTYGPLDQMIITTHIYTTIPGFFLWGRMLTVVAGSLTAVAVYWLGRRSWNLAAGLSGALFLALSQFHMQHSQYVTTDVASGFLVLLCFLFAVAVADQGRWRDYLLSGLFSGLAASTKYNAGVIALAIVVAHLLHWRWRALAEAPRLIAAGGLSIIGFFVGTPYALLNWPEFIKGLAGQWLAYNDGAQGDIRGEWNLRGYTSFFWNDGLYPTGSIATLAGLAILLIRRPRVALVWLSFAMPYLLMLLAQSTHFMRNLIPLVVLCALPIGVAFAAAWNRLSHYAPRYRLLLAAALLMLLVLPGASDTFAYARRLDRGDTRAHMLAWLDASVPPGARVAAELKPLPGPLESPWTSAETLLGYDLAWYRRQGYAFLIASSDTWRQWDLPADYALFGAPAAEFGGATPRDMFGPHLVIYRTGLGPQDVPEPLPGDLRFGGVRLLGSAIGQPEAIGLQPAHVFKAGTTVGLRTFWQVEQPLDRDYFIFVHLLDQQGNRKAQRDTPPWQGRFPTSSWQVGTLVVDVNDLPLPAELAPGDYTLIVGMFDPASGARPPILRDGTPFPEPAVQIARITIEK